MLETHRRPFTDIEREQVEQELLDLVNSLPPGNAEALGVGALCAFFGLFISDVIAAFLAFLELPSMWVGVAIGFGVVAGFVLGWHDQKGTEQAVARYRKAQTAVLARRLQRGEMEEITVTASGVVEVNFDDEGTSYFFDIEASRVFLLYGETLWEGQDAPDPETEDLPPLPATFRVTRYPDAPEEIVSFVAAGPNLTPLCSIDLISQAGFEDVYKNGTVFENVSLATLANDLPLVGDRVDG